MSDTHEYRLRDGVERIVRSGLVLTGDETVELDADDAARFEDVIERVDDGSSADVDDTSEHAEGS